MNALLLYTFYLYFMDLTSTGSSQNLKGGCVVDSENVELKDHTGAIYKSGFIAEPSTSYSVTCTDGSKFFGDSSNWTCGHGTWTKQGNCERNCDLPAKNIIYEVVKNTHPVIESRESITIKCLIRPTRGIYNILVCRDGQFETAKCAVQKQATWSTFIITGVAVLIVATTAILGCYCCGTAHRRLSMEHDIEVLHKFAARRVSLLQHSVAEMAAADVGQLADKARSTPDILVTDHSVSVKNPLLITSMFPVEPPRDNPVNQCLLQKMVLKRMSTLQTSSGSTRHSPEQLDIKKLNRSPPPGSAER